MVRKIIIKNMWKMSSNFVKNSRNCPCFMIIKVRIMKIERKISVKDVNSFIFNDISTNRGGFL